MKLIVKTYLKKAVITAAASLWAASVLAQSSDPLNEFLTDTKAATGSFEQQTYQKDGKPAESPQSGIFAFYRPGKFIWTYKTPYEQQMVCDGNRIYVWDKDLNQVTVRSAKKSIPQSPAAILFGTSSYQKDWNASKPEERDGLTWITLSPKSRDASVRSVEFGFKGKELKKMKFVGSMGEMTHLEINELETNAKLSQKDFEFSMPKGADVVEIR